LQPGPGWASPVAWQRLFTQLLQGPQLSPGQQLPSTQDDPHSFSPPGQEPLHAWLRGMQALLHS